MGQGGSRTAPCDCVCRLGCQAGPAGAAWGRQIEPPPAPCTHSAQVETAERLGLDRLCSPQEPASAGSSGGDAAAVLSVLDDMISWVQRPHAAGLPTAAPPPRCALRCVCALVLALQPCCRHAPICHPCCCATAGPGATARRRRRRRWGAACTALCERWSGKSGRSAARPPRGSGRRARALLQLLWQPELSSSRQQRTPRMESCLAAAAAQLLLVQPLWRQRRRLRLSYCACPRAAAARRLQ